MRRTIPSIVIALALSACKDKSGDTADPGVAPQNIEGDAPGEGSVSAARQADDGSFEPAAAESQTDGDGHYRLGLDGSVEAGSTFLVRFTGADGATAEVLVTAQADADGTVYATDMDEESSAEAAVWVEIAASGEADGDSAPLLARLLVDAELAAAVSGAESGAEEAAEVVASMGGALQAAFEAHSDDLRAFLEDSYAAGDAQAAADGQHDGEVGGELRLDGLVEAAEREGGWSAAEVSITLHAAAEAAAAAATADGATTGVEATAQALVEHERMVASTAVVASAMASLGATGAGAAAAEAALEAEVAALQSGLAGSGWQVWDEDLSVGSALSGAWSDYGSAAMLDLSIAFGAEGEAALAEAVQVAAVLRAEAALRIDAAAAAQDAESMGEEAQAAMASYAAAAQAEVQSVLDASGAMSATEAEVAASVVVELVASGAVD